MDSTRSWHATVQWIGPPLSRSMSTGDGRIWRWNDIEAETPGIGFPPIRDAEATLLNPPGANQPGLGLVVDGRPWIAAGRHPCRHSRTSSDPSWHSQAVLLPSSDGTWTNLGVFEDRFQSGILRAATGEVVTEVARPGRVRTPVRSGDSFALDGVRYGLEPVFLDLPVGRKRRFWSRTDLVGIRITGPLDGQVRAELIADQNTTFNGDVSSTVHAVWDGEPGIWEAAVALCSLACAIDGDYRTSNG